MSTPYGLQIEVGGSNFAYSSVVTDYHSQETQGRVKVSSSIEEKTPHSSVFELYSSHRLHLRDISVSNSGPYL